MTRPPWSQWLFDTSFASASSPVIGSVTWLRNPPSTFADTFSQPVGASPRVWPSPSRRSFKAPGW